ncbi:MAG: MBL fold metallo-hydrolase [Planctomycetota bacterium]|nr:MBL fold metallo-hydrolase [Planctomycetota bacterium]
MNGINGQGSPRLNLVNLGSGSSGNCTLLDAEQHGASCQVLIDLGFSMRRTRRQLRELGTDLSAIDHVFLTHLDRDHFNPSWARTLSSMQIPVHVAPGHAGAALRSGCPEECLSMLPHHMQLEGGLEVHAISVAHDVSGCTAFRFELGEKRLGFATDLGHVPDELVEFFSGVHVLAFESNYDRSMQIESDRPEFLKQRIMGGRGHLSNEQSLNAVLRIADGGDLESIMLLHLSRQCNASWCIDELYAACAPQLRERLVITSQTEATPWIKCIPLVPAGGN